MTALRTLLALLAAMLLSGSYLAGGGPALELESPHPSCRVKHCWCIDIRTPQWEQGEATTGDVVAEDPATSG